MTPNESKNFTPEDTNVIDVASEPVNESSSDTSKSLGDTKIEHKSAKAGIAEQNQERIREVMAKKEKGEPLSAADRVVLSFAEKGKKHNVKEARKEKQKPLETERKDLASEFLESFRDENKNRRGLGENKRKEINQALKTLDKSEGMELAEKIIGTAIKERAEKLEKFPNLIWAEVDKRIMRYISGVVPNASDKEKVESFLLDSRIPIIETYLDIARQKIGADKKERMDNLISQFKKIKKEVQTQSPERTPESKTKTEIEKPVEKSQSQTYAPELESEQFIVGMENKDTGIGTEKKYAFSSEKIESQTNTIEVKKDLARDLEVFAEQEFQKSIKEKKKDSKDDFIKNREQNLSEKLWQENFNKLQSNLSKAEQKELEELMANGTKVLEGNDVKNLFMSGLNLSEIKDIKYKSWWSRKIKSPLSSEPIKDEELEKLIGNKTKEAFKRISENAKKILGDVWEKSHKVFINSVVNNELNKLEKQEKKKEVALTLPPEKKLELLNNIRDRWQQAEKIDKSLKTGKKIKVAENEILDPKLHQLELIEAKGLFSDEIIKFAEELTGRNLKKDASEKTGYKFDKDPEKQKEYQKWLTSEVKKIYNRQVKEVEMATGKKIKVVKKLNKITEVEVR